MNWKNTKNKYYATYREVVNHETLNKLFDVADWDKYDLPEALALTRRYLDEYTDEQERISNIDSTSDFPEKNMIFIKHFCIFRIKSRYSRNLLKKVISQSQAGFISYNVLAHDNMGDTV